MQVRVKIKKVHENARVPVLKSRTANEIELTAVEIITSGNLVTYKTGLQIELPLMHVAFILAPNDLKTTGLTPHALQAITPYDRSEVEVVYQNTKKNNEGIYTVGDIVAKLLIVPQIHLNIIESSELSSTPR